MKIIYLGLAGALSILSADAFGQQKLSDGSEDNILVINSDAILELASKNKGLLHTRVALDKTTNAAPLGKHVAGMMVYNTVTANDVVPGIYYNDGAKWVLASGGKATAISYDPNTYIISYVDVDGNPVNIDFKKVVKDNETVTKLQQNANGTYTYFNEVSIDEAGNPIAGSGVIIDIPASVIQNFENILKDESVKNDLFQTIHNSYVGGNVYYDGNKFTYVNQAGETKEITIKEIVEMNQTVTQLVANEDGTYTYFNEVSIDEAGNPIAGTGVIIDIPASVIQNFENILKDESVKNDLFQTIHNSYVGGNVYYDGDKFTYVNQAGETKEITIKEIVEANETKTILTKNPNGTYTYKNEEGIDVTFDPTLVNITEENGIYAFKDAEGNTIETIDTKASASFYDNSTSGLTAEDVQAAIDELVAKLGAGAGVKLVDNKDGKITLVSDKGDSLGTVDKSQLTNNNDGTYTFKTGTDSDVIINVVGDVVTNITAKGPIYNEIIKLINAETDLLVDNNDGTYTHTTVAGDIITINANTTKVTIAEGVYTFTDGAGNEITKIDTKAKATSYDNSTSGLTAKDVQAAIDELVAKLGAGAGVKLVDNKDGKITLVSDKGDALGTVDKSQLTNNNDGTYTFKTGTDSDVIINVVGDVVTNITAKGPIYNEIIKLINAETDLLVDNSDGTYTHTTVAGDTITINANTTKVTIAEGVYTFTDGAGNEITKIDTKAKATSYDNSTSGLTAKDVQAAIDELVAKLGAGAGVKLIDNKDGKITLVSDKGDSLGTVDKSQLTNNNDGTYTFKTGTDSDVTINVVGDVVTNITAKGPIYDEIIKLINAETDLLVDNNDGTYTHTTVAGDTITINANTTKVTIAEGVYTFTDGAGNEITKIDTKASASFYDNSTSGLTAEDVQAAIDELVAKLGAGAGVKLVDNKDGKITLVSDKGDSLGTVDKSQLTNNNDGTYTFKTGTDSDVIINVVGDVVTNITAKGPIYDEIIKLINAETDLLVDNSDGTYTHTTVAGDTITINANTTKVTIAEGVYTFTDGAGNEITKIDTKASASFYDNSTSGLTAEDVQAAIDELVAKLGAGAGVKLVDNKDGKITLVSDKGDSLGTVDKSQLTNNNDGTYTFTNGDGKDIIIDTHTTALIDGKQTTVSSAVDANDRNKLNWKVDVATAQGAQAAAGEAAAKASTLGVVKEAAENPTVLINQAGELSVNLAAATSIKKVTGEYAVAAADAILLGDALNGEVTITLPAANAANKGKKISIKKHDNNEDHYVNVLGSIHGLNEPSKGLYTALPYSGWDLVSDGETWQIVNKF